MKTHTEILTADLLALCDLTEHFIINAVAADPKKSFRKQAEIIAAVRHEIAEANRPDPKQKELPGVTSQPKKRAAKLPPKGRQKRDDRPDVTSVLVGKQQRAPVRKTGKQRR